MSEKENAERNENTARLLLGAAIIFKSAIEGLFDEKIPKVFSEMRSLHREVVNDIIEIQEKAMQVAGTIGGAAEQAYQAAALNGDAAATMEAAAKQMSDAAQLMDSASRRR